MISDDDIDLLAFEEKHPHAGGMKAEQIRQRFDLSPTRYYMRLHRILDEPEVHDLAPDLARTLIERKDSSMKRVHARLIPREA